MIAPGLKHRIRRLAESMRCCSTHGCKLLCIKCMASRGEWLGSRADLAEVSTLLDRLRPYRDQIFPSGQRCHCGGDLWCRPCHDAAAAQVHVPEDLFTPAECSRYAELVKLFGLQPPPD
jgi:hypothetical protein